MTAASATPAARRPLRPHQRALAWARGVAARAKGRLPRRRTAARDEGAEAAAVGRRGRVGRTWVRARRATDRYRLLTDVLGALVIVGVVLGGLAFATGGTWPPVVVVESGSMMHGYHETPYGRWGTIDVGDLVFIRGVSHDEIDTWAEGGEMRYGRPGDVIAFAQNGDRANTSIIHRAIARVDVERAADGNITYRLHWTDGQVLTFGNAGIYFPPLGFSEDYGFSPSNGYRPAYGGFLTKGDNAFTNPATDQALNISRMVDPSWIIGDVYGELPWIGMGKLMLQSGKTNPEVPGWDRIGNAFAPLEIWSMFFLTLAVVVLVPFSIDTHRAWRRHRELVRERREAMREQEALARERRERRAQQRPPPPPPPPPAPPPPAPRRTTTLQVVARPQPRPQPRRDP